MESYGSSEKKQTGSSTTGTIFNIQKFSVNDGPGIRTVVFLKGCPLRCKWCSNPESQLPGPQVLWNQKNCIGCHHCVSVCPVQAITAAGEQIQIHAEHCNGCMQCVRECPEKALKTEGEQKTTEEILKIVMQDLPFYEESGGGLTLSGGECLSQPDFATALVKGAKQNGLHVCCETTGFAAPDIFDRVTAQIDCILFDMKHWDDAKHREGTGVSNAIILDNMRRAAAAGKDILPRIPVIPGFNDTLEDAARFAECLKSIGIFQAQLLPFHQFGENKYNLLGKHYAYTDIPALHREDLEEYRQIFITHGVKAFF